MKVFCFLTAMLGALFAAAPLSAQFESATLTGVITDPAAAVVSAARITATNEATNTAQSVVSGEDGRYLFTNLRPGTYRISASAPGFKQEVASNIVLQVNQAARLDIRLTVGDLSE